MLSCLYLLTQPSHLLHYSCSMIQSIRMENNLNNWLTEILKLLDCIDPVSNQKMDAVWKDIADLYQYEKTQMIRMSKLTKAAIYHILLT